MVNLFLKVFVLSASILWAWTIYVGGYSVKPWLFQVFNVDYAGNWVWSSTDIISLKNLAPFTQVLLEQWTAAGMSLTHRSQHAFLRFSGCNNCPWKFSPFTITQDFFHDKSLQSPVGFSVYHSPEVSLLIFNEVSKIWIRSRNGHCLNGWWILSKCL